MQEMLEKSAQGTHIHIKQGKQEIYAGPGYRLQQMVVMMLAPMLVLQLVAFFWLCQQGGLFLWQYDIGLDDEFYGDVGISLKF